MSASSAPAPACTSEHCITCADDGVPMTVLRTDEQRGLALCADRELGHHTVETALLAPLAAGSLVLVHAGVAIAALEREEAP